MTTGVRYFSDRLKARTVSEKISWTYAGVRQMAGWSPCVPQRHCMMSLCPGPVGTPVDGPPRITFTMTHGISVRAANPMFSCLRENPGPDVAVSAFRPASDPPITAAIAAISSSICRNAPRIRGRRLARYSATSVEGVIGYPAKNVHPA